MKTTLGEAGVSEEKGGGRNIRRGEGGDEGIVEVGWGVEGKRGGDGRRVGREGERERK